MKTFTRFILLMMAVISVTYLAQAQSPDDDPWALSFTGNVSDHEGFAAWDADGSGPEPYGVGHQAPLPGLSNYSYYAASADYDGINPDPNAGLGHLIDDNTGFPSFLAALQSHGYNLAQVTARCSLFDLADDTEGFDWFLVDGWSHAFYYNGVLTIYVDGEPLITLDFLNIDNHTSLSISNHLLVGSYAMPDSAWSGSSAAVKDVGRALVRDLDGEELRLVGELDYSYQTFNSNGRDGAFWNTSFKLEKGLPSLPYQGLSGEHQGLACWNADGTGPEPLGQGHTAPGFTQQYYYGASRDYMDIDPDTNAALGHLLDDMKGFNNFMLQIKYRGYSMEQLRIKTGLCSLGEDVQGEDWDITNNTYWNNYYNAANIIDIDGTPIIKSKTDTSKLTWMNGHWADDGSVDKPMIVSSALTADEAIIAEALLKDLETRFLYNEINNMSTPIGSFFSNGRSGAYCNVTDARMVAKKGQQCCFVQCDTIGAPMTAYTRWTTAKSPYFVDKSFVVPENHELIIDPGVVVMMRGAHEIEVNGKVTAIGTGPDNMVTFTRSNPLVYWDGFRIDNMPENAGPTTFTHCLFEYGATFSAVPTANNSGGAISIREFSDVTFSNCIFRYNKAEFVGGAFPPTGAAMALWESSPVIDQCEFYENTAKNAGAIQCYINANPTITGCTFRNNTAQEDGGAICLRDNCSPLLQGNLFVYNYAGALGGAMRFTDNCDPVLNSNTIAYNQAGDSNSPGYGGGIHVLSSSDPVLNENILWGNVAYNAANTAQQIGLAYIGPTVNCYYNDIEGGNEGIGPVANTGDYENNIDADPGFCFPEELNFYLMATSPCLTAGPEGGYIGAYDFGCYTEVAEQPGTQEWLKVFPNPVIGDDVAVAFTLVQQSRVKLEIYNLLGECIAIPMDGQMPSGEHMVTVSLANLPGGTYICRLVADGATSATKFIRKK